MLSQISVQMAFFLAATLTLASVVIAVSLFWKMRLVRQELDDQGIKLIQLTNLQSEAKKESDSLRSTMASVVEHLEKTHVRKPAHHSAQKERDDEPTEKLPSKLTKPKFKAVEKAAEKSVEPEDDPEVPTNVKFKSEDSTDDYEASERANVVPNANMRELSSSDFEPSQSQSEVSAKREVELKKDYRNMETFLQAFEGKVTKVGLFFPSRDSIAVGTRVEFRFRLDDGTPLMGGKGEVKRAHADGVEIRFIYVDPDSKAMIRRLTGKK